MNTVLAINGRVYNPVVIDSLSNVKFAGPNTSYTLNVTEKYVKPGFILPKGQEKGYPGSSNTFTVTFQKPGTYKYLSIVRPWMTGKVVVVKSPGNSPPFTSSFFFVYRHLKSNLAMLLYSEI